MKTPTLIVTAAVIFAAAVELAPAGEHVTLTVESQTAQPVASATCVTLHPGDTAELVFCSFLADSAQTASNVSLLAIIDNKSYSLPVSRVIAKNNLGNTYDLNRVKIAGPAVVKLQIVPVPEAQKEFATVEVSRAGTASGPAGIPDEAGSTWQVFLEASTDLILWIPVPPGDYPGNSPQRFFRTRIVKRP